MRVLYTRIDKQLSPSQYECYLNQIPLHSRDKIKRFHRWEDDHLSLFGKLLLSQGLHQVGISHVTLEDMMFDRYSRPYFSGGPSFNISHAANYVVCAIDPEQSAVGIDIEKYNAIDIDDFRSQWTEDEYQNIAASEDRIRQFFMYWTRKEAIVKGDGRGLSIPLRTISVVDLQVEVAGKIWYLNEVDIDQQYVCHLATMRPVTTISTQYLEF